MENITESNQIIDAFMGNQITDANGNVKTDRELKYHTSWDWLMPVIIKIKKTERRGKGEYLSIMNRTLSMCESMDYTYHNVVSFIKWYTETNQSKYDKH